MTNPLYATIARLIQTNTLKNRFNTVEVIDKKDLVETIADYFQNTDALFNRDEFAKACEEDQ